MTLSKILMAGVAFGALAAAPAMARQAPNFHLVSHGMTKATTGKHLKSNIHLPPTTNFTETATFSASAFSIKTNLKKKVILLGETWLSSTCVQPTKQKWVGLPKTTTYAAVSASTSTGTLTSCPGVTFTFQDIDYKLTTKPAVGAMDEVSGTLTANKFQGYNLKLLAHIDLTFAK